MTEEDRSRILKERQQLGLPWHGPPHGLERKWYHVTAACYEHQCFIGASPKRMNSFERELLETVRTKCTHVLAWCLLPSHYHLLVQCLSLPELRGAIGRLHNGTSTRWNKEDKAAGRKCWHRCVPREIKSEEHRLVTINYIHHNPVHHRYASRWQDWPYSSAADYLQYVGREEVERLWNEYPLLDMGKGWDDPGIG